MSFHDSLFATHITNGKCERAVGANDEERFHCRFKHYRCAEHAKLQQCCAFVVYIRTLKYLVLFFLIVLLLLSVYILENRYTYILKRK
jgi:hypothetical protein